MHVASKSPPRVRAGGTALSLIAAPLGVPILRAHLGGPLRLPDLRERIGGTAQTTLRGQVGNLRGIGALERHVRSGMPYTVENELTDAGRSILAVADLVEAWLTRAPQGPIALGGKPAKGAIMAMIGGWGSSVLHTLAARPFSLTELNGVIAEISYPSLERRLSAMRAARQIEVVPGGQRGGKPYVVTDWGRQAVAPLLAAGRCESAHMPDVIEPLTRIDIEAVFLLAMPLVELEVIHGGSCLLAVDTGADRDLPPGAPLAGIHIEIERGNVVSCASRLEHVPTTWALGDVEAWVETILAGDTSRLRLGGRQPGLAQGLVERLHTSL